MAVIFLMDDPDDAPAKTLALAIVDGECAEHLRAGNLDAHIDHAFAPHRNAEGMLR